MAAERKQKAERQHELELKKLELKKRDQALTDAKIAGKLETAKLKEVELKIKQDKNVLKQNAKDAAALNKTHNLQLATHVYRQFKRLWESGEDSNAWQKIEKFVVQKADKGQKIRAVGKTCPAFFEVEQSLMRDVSLQAMPCSGKKKMAHIPIFASEAMSAVIFGGSQEKCKDRNPKARLKHTIASTFPRYHVLMPCEFHADDLLAKNNNCIDKAFLEAAWRFTVTLGKRLDKVSGEEVDARKFFVMVPEKAAAAASSSAVVSTSAASSSGAASSSTAAGPSCGASSDSAVVVGGK